MLYKAQNTLQHEINNPKNEKKKKKSHSTFMLHCSNMKNCIKKLYLKTILVDCAIQIEQNSGVSSLYFHDNWENNFIKYMHNYHDLQLSKKLSAIMVLSQ